MDLKQEAELAKRTHRLPDLFADRLPARDMEDIQSAAGGGEWGLMLADILASLRLSRTPITAAEFDELRAVLIAWSLPTDQLRIALIEGSLPDELV